MRAGALESVMAGSHRNHACPCGTERKYKRCCLPLHNGKHADTPEALMRSRYSAYALGLAEYVMATTHPDGPHFEADPGYWRDDLLAYCRAVQFQGLEVMSHAQHGDVGSVRFKAELSRDGEDVSFVEHSRFQRVDGHWLYHSAL